MAEPSKKSKQLEQLLEERFSRTTSIRADRCIPPPVGCGGEATKFRNDLSRREYTISGLCQKCQDTIFGKNAD